MLYQEKSNNNQIDGNTPLYSSKIIYIYLEFIKKYHPEIDKDSLLSYAGMTLPEVEDAGHWFNQNQTNRFNKFLVEKTGNSKIAREAGRYTVSSDRIGTTKQYALGAITLSSVYKMVGKIANNMTRGSTFKVKKMAANKAEILSKPKPGVIEKPYQCQNRIGSLESVAKLFTKTYAEVEHPTCFHQGGEHCRYIVTWPTPSSLTWKRIGTYSLIVSVLILLGVSALALNLVTSVLVGCLIINIAIWLNVGRIENKELKETIKTQGNTAQKYLDEIDTQYNNTQLILEIGQTVSGCLDINKINRDVLKVIEKHVHYDYGSILIVNEEKTKLHHSAELLSPNGQIKFLKRMEFDLKSSNDNGILTECVNYQKNFIINDVNNIERDLNIRCSAHLKLNEIQSVICVPIVYEKESIGVLIVGKHHLDKAITKSDINLLMGIASHTASSITNSVSFIKIKESEKRYRLLANNVTDVIWILDIESLQYKYVSPSVKRMQGFTPEELTQIPLQEILVPNSFKKATEVISEELKIASTEGMDPNRSRTLELEEYCKDGSTIWIEVAASFLRDDSMNIIGVLGVTRDISNRKLAETEREKLKKELRHAQKMEAIGTLAGGIAHDFNNILSSVIGFTELAMDMDDVEEGTLLHEYLSDVLTAGNRAKDLVNQILTMSRHEDQETNQSRLLHLLKKR